MISKQLFCIVALLSAAVYAIDDENSFLQVKLESEQGKKLYVITKKDKKLQEINAVIGEELKNSGVQLVKKALKLDEIQGDAVELAQREAKEAVSQGAAPVLVDVKSIEFVAFNGLPGPYFGHFHDKVGSQGLVDMLSAFDDKAAVAKTVFVYLKSAESEPQVFVGEVYGFIVEPGNVEGFKWEDIFAPLGYETTLSQLDEEARREYSPFNRGLKLFGNYIVDQPDWI